ncbi:EAL domain-containing protein [Aquisalimonas lutea]|uniref:GGDEF/EAL domain-containing response regulator n=1 Tax=Aquisalimonas lutea TaxID=1327750 RepID=UPI0025B38420|nr:EAL domain-containing protein [Aquisalimonas lutea]MDN3517438.1 EAL domain-containing protein [Aquisalimonas lutea]
MAARTTAPGTDAPVLVTFRDADMADRLARMLRDFGFRTRSVVSLDVLRNAARATPPGAVILDEGFLADDADGLPVRKQDLGADAGVPPLLVVIGRNDALPGRLRAVRAGADAWLTRPFNPSVLAHRLHQMRGGTTDAAARLLVVDEGGELAAAAAPLAGDDLEPHFLDRPQELLARLESVRPDILLVSGDLASVDAGELLQVVRQDVRHYGIPALIVTAGDKRRFDGLAARAGIDGVVGLPVATEDLYAIVRSRLERVTGLQSGARYLARRDPETGLDSNGHFLDELRQALALTRGGEQRTTLLHLRAWPADGAAEADHRTRRALMVALARRLQHLLPATAVATRLDEGDYAALLYGLGDGELQALTARLQDALDQQSPPTRARIGLTLLRPDLASADAALERARQAGDGPDRAGAAAPEDTAAVRDPGADAAFRGALDQGRFRLVYQPLASLSGNPVSLYEAFIRMLDEHGGELLPQEFLPAAARLGLTPQLDQWIIRHSLEVLASQARRDHRPVLFLKLFPETVSDERFPRWLADQLQQHGVPGDRLVFQLTQEAAAARLAETRRLAEALRSLGCALALEHYGAAADPNDLLQQLPLSYIKLSPRLTDVVGSDSARRAEVQALTGHARANGIRTIAALVQDASVLSVLWASGVDYIQGYFMQAPSDIFDQDETRGGS